MGVTRRREEFDFVPKSDDTASPLLHIQEFAILSQVGYVPRTKSFIVPSFGSAIRREDGTIDFFFAYLSEESSEGFADNAACIPFDQLSNT